MRLENGTCDDTYRYAGDQEPQRRNRGDPGIL